MRPSLLLLVLAGCGAADPPSGARDAGAGASVLSTGLLHASPYRFGHADRRWSAPAGTDLPTAAWAWVSEFAPTRGIGAEGVASLTERRRVPLRNGGGVITFRGVADGAPVLESDVSVLFDGGLHPVAWSVGPGFGPALGTHGRGEVRLSASEAARRGVGARGPLTAATDGWQATTDGARVRRVWWPEAARLRAAWEVEGRTEAAVVAADDGEVLRRRDLVDDAFTYRVWADTSGNDTPADNPWEDLTPHPTGSPDGVEGVDTEASLVTIDGLDALGDPWLASDATTTSGNNADVWSDRDGDDVFDGDDVRGELSAATTFDHAYDFTVDATADDEQTQAAIVQAFYVTNWLHDWYYDAGFTETAANGQLSNYGRGGSEGDPLHIEVQSAYTVGARDNANMSTPEDGAPPVMHIYVWSPEVTGDFSVDGTAYVFGSASFGPSTFDVTAPLSFPSDPLACSTPSEDLNGTIALVDRGTCTFVEKALAVQAAGASGVVIRDASPGAPAFSPGGFDATVTIPAIGLGYDDGRALRDAGVGTATLRSTEGPERDGALDNTVVSHEWGHYLHHRLASCGYPQCSAMSEGWADFTALLMMLRDGDDTHGAFPVGGWAYAGSSADPTYYGIRRQPYSVEFAYDALTFQHISEGVPLPTSAPMSNDGSPNSESHNAGEVWATALWGAYVALQDHRTGDESFDDVHRRMTDIVVAGLALTPSEATYTEQRDALLAAASAIDADSAGWMAEAFAERGMGSCAVSPDRASSDFAGVVEDYGVSPGLTLGTPEFTDGDRSCDDDGLLDDGERGLLKLPVTNSGGVTLSGATVTLAADVAGLTFPDGDTVTVPDLAPWATTELELPVDLDRTVADRTVATLTIVADAPDACTTEATAALTLTVQADEASAVATADTFDADDLSWVGDGEVWTRTQADPGVWGWLGADTSGISDTRLVSPVLEVDAAADFRVDLDQSWSFETSDGTYWDGGVLELRVDGGDWQDVSTWVDPGYGGVLTGVSGNPLANRSAFVATNPSWPADDTLGLDFGTALAGHSVELGFRVGTDQAAGAIGWFVDRVAVAGITNTPFPALVAQADVCNPAPVADAGPDQDVNLGATVTLDGSASTDPWGDPLTYAWTVVEGDVTLDDATAVSPTFTATVAGTVTLELTVGDGVSAATDSVDVDITPIDTDEPPEDTGTRDSAPAATPKSDEPAGCGCTVTRAPAPGFVLLTTSVAAWLRRRRSSTGSGPGTSSTRRPRRA